MVQLLLIIMLGNLMMLRRQSLIALGNQPLVGLDLSFDLTLFTRHLLRLL